MRLDVGLEIDLGNILVILDFLKRIERSDVAKHFNLVGHNTENVDIVGLLHCSNTFQRKQCETKLISKLGTLVPFGMNKD